MSIVQNHDTFTPTGTLNGEDRVALARMLAAELEHLAIWPSSDRLDDLIVARRCMDQLRGLFSEMKSLRPVLRRGAEAMRHIHSARREEAAKLRAERSVAYAEKAATIASSRDDWASSELQKRRIIRILAAAAIEANPSKFTPHVRECRNVWKNLGPSGSQRELIQDYIAASTDFWNAVKAEHAALRDTASLESIKHRRFGGILGSFTLSGWVR